MTQTISWSHPQDATSWKPKRVDGGVMVSPFDMESILRACPALLAEWQKAPFILTLGYDGRVEVKFWSPEMDRE